MRPKYHGAAWLDKPTENPQLGHCEECKKGIGRENMINYLCIDCHQNFHKQEKFEEIKQMAWELIKDPTSLFNRLNEYWEPLSIEDAWKKAEKFYDYAKQKEKEIEE